MSESDHAANLRAAAGLLYVSALYCHPDDEPLADRLQQAHDVLVDYIGEGERLRGLLDLFVQSGDMTLHAKHQIDQALQGS